MAEAEVEPPHVVLVDDYFLVYKNRRRVFVSGQEPPGLQGDRGIPWRAWIRHQNLMTRETAWDRAERYRRLMAEGGHSSVRALARTLGEDFSMVTRWINLELPVLLLEALRKHAANPKVRAYFSARRLRQIVAKGRPEDAVRMVEKIAGPALPK